MKRLTLPIVLVALGCLALGGTAVAQDAEGPAPQSPLAGLAAEHQEDVALEEDALEALAQDAAALEAAALAKAAQNPLASLVTLPLQANYNLGTGPYDRTFFNLNVQPVVPIAGEKWNVITRTIIPLNSVPTGQTDSTFGVGDTTLQLLFSPAKGSSFTWGLGPVFGLPTASNPEILGSGKWGLGPAGVVFFQTGRWTMGGLVSNTWSVAGADDRDAYNRFVLQCFVNNNFGGGWAVGSVPIVTADWKAEPGQRWTIPWGLQVSKVTRIAGQPVNLLAGYYWNSTHPDGGAESQVRLQLNFMFPNK